MLSSIIAIVGGLIAAASIIVAKKTKCSRINRQNHPISRMDWSCSTVLEY